MERIRRVCKRRAARGCTAPTFRGEAGDPIAMHHPVLPTTIRYSCTYATLSQLRFPLPFLSSPRFVASDSFFLVSFPVFFSVRRGWRFFSPPSIFYLFREQDYRLSTTIRALVFPRTQFDRRNCCSLSTLYDASPRFRFIYVSRAMQRRYLVCDSSCNLGSLEAYCKVDVTPSVEP